MWVVALSTLTSVGERCGLGQTSGEVTFAKDIAPILQRSCQNCHRADGAAPMRSPPMKRCGRGRGPSSSGREWARERA